MSRLGQTFLSAGRLADAHLRSPAVFRRQVVTECLKLGGVYVKFLQILAVHHSTKSFFGGISTRQAFDEVPFEEIDTYTELKKHDVFRHFSHVEITPFAAGSYGQVYKARLLDQTEVIIKILRPSVARSQNTDLRIIGCVAWVAQFFTKRSFVDVRSVYTEFATATKRETDYIHEAYSGEYLREYFIDNGSLVIPRSFPELGSETILVQEYMAGISLSEVMDRQKNGEQIDRVVYAATGSNIWEQLHVLGKDFLKATLIADTIMADPHPGNIRLLPDNKVALIDFGLVADAPANRTAFANLIGEFLRLYRGEFEPGSFALSMLAFYDPELFAALQQIAGEEDYSLSLQELVNKRAGSLKNDTRFQYFVNDKQVTKLFSEVLTQNNALAIKLDESNILLQRSMGVYLSIVRAIGEQYGVAAPHFSIIEAVLADVYQYAKSHNLGGPLSRSMPTEIAYEVVSDWLSVVAERDRKIYTQLIGKGIV